MGYGGAGCCWRVELPLALPPIMAGLRVATVSTVALTTVGAIIGYGGLGNLIFEAAEHPVQGRRCSPPPCCAWLLAVAVDLLLLGTQRLLTPWARTRAA